jgi:hypothetical protein
VVKAGSQVVLDIREAEVTYWPITQEYLTDVSRSSPGLEGDFEIVDDDGNVRELAQVPYLLWYPYGVGAGSAQLVLDEQASELYRAYVLDARAAAEAMRTYQRIVAEHHSAVEAWLRIAAERPSELPKPPPELDIGEPEPFNAFATEPELATVITLDPGPYTVRVRGADGKVIASSERRIVAFEAQANGVGYVVRPGDRWTQPSISFNPKDRIYTTARTDLYVQPVPVSEFQARDFSRLFRPQSIEAADPFLTVWIPQNDTSISGDGTAKLALKFGKDTVDEVPAKAFRVSQTIGKSLGYTIEEHTVGDGSPLEPDFSAMRIARDQRVTEISLVGEHAFPASERVIRNVPTPNVALLYLAALLPVAFGMALRVIRRATPPQNNGTSGGGSGRGGWRQAMTGDHPDGPAGAISKPNTP